MSELDIIISKIMESTLTGIIGGLVVYWTFKNVQFGGGELQNKKLIKYPAIFFILFSITGIIALFSLSPYLIKIILILSIIIGIIFIVFLIVSPRKILTHKQLSTSR